LDIPSRVLYPRLIPQAKVAVHSANGFQYYRPIDFANGKCWAAPLPCSDRELTDTFLLAPEKGIAGGFRYQEKRSEK
jgi:hypothetical protein